MDASKMTMPNIRAAPRISFGRGVKTATSPMPSASQTPSKRYSTISDEKTEEKRTDAWRETIYARVNSPMRKGKSMFRKTPAYRARNAEKTGMRHTGVSKSFQRTLCMAYLPTSTNMPKMASAQFMEAKSLRSTSILIP